MLKVMLCGFIRIFGWEQVAARLLVRENERLAKGCCHLSWWVISEVLVAFVTSQRGGFKPYIFSTYCFLKSGVRKNK